MARKTRKSEGISSVRQFRCTESEWTKIKTDAGDVGLTVSEWIRFALTEADVNPLLVKVQKAKSQLSISQIKQNMKGFESDAI